MCLSIKTYTDNERLIVAIDGLSKTSHEDICKNFLSGLTKTNIPGVAGTSGMRDEIPETDRFTGGPYKGQTPEDAIKDLKDKSACDTAVKYFSSVIDILDDDRLKRKIILAGKKYLHERFNAADTAQYGAKLTEKQLINFYILYSPYITSETRKVIFEETHSVNWTAFLFNDASILRKYIEVILKSF